MKGNGCFGNSTDFQSDSFVSKVVTIEIRSG